MADRIQIAFDLDTKVCEQILGHEYANVYKSIQKYMEEHDFEHRQGSVYHSRKPMPRTVATAVIGELLLKYPYLEKCVRDITFARIGRDVSLNDMFSYDGTAGEYRKLYRRRDEEMSR